MFTWPGTSALIGVTCNFIAISIIFFFAYSAFTPEPFYEDPETEDTPEDIGNVGSEPQPHRAARSRPSTSSEGSVRQTHTPQNGVIMANGRFKPVGSKHRPYKVKQIQQSATLPPRDYEYSDGLLRSATFPPYRWECEGEGKEPGPGKETQAFGGTPLHQAQCSASRSSSLSSGAGCVGWSARCGPVPHPAGASYPAVGATRLRKTEAQRQQASTNPAGVTPVATHRDIVQVVTRDSHAITAQSGHASVDGRNTLYEEDGGSVFEAGLKSLPGGCVRNVADGECSYQYGPPYDEASTYSPRLSHSSLSSEDCVPAELSYTQTKEPLCSAHGDSHTDGGEHATVICNCGATQMSKWHFEGRVPDGAPAQRGSSIQQVTHGVAPSFAREPVQNTTLNSGCIKGPYNDGPYSGEPCGEIKMTSGQVKYDDPGQGPQLKRRSVAKSRAGFRLTFKKIISKK